MKTLSQKLLTIIMFCCATQGLADEKQKDLNRSIYINLDEALHNHSLGFDLLTPVTGSASATVLSVELGKGEDIATKTKRQNITFLYGARFDAAQVQMLSMNSQVGFSTAKRADHKFEYAALVNSYIGHQLNVTDAISLEIRIGARFQLRLDSIAQDSSVLWTAQIGSALQF